MHCFWEKIRLFYLISIKVRFSIKKKNSKDQGDNLLLLYIFIICIFIKSFS